MYNYPDYAYPYSFSPTKGSYTNGPYSNGSSWKERDPFNTAASPSQGFQNIGNTCYLNSGLQCFLHSPNVIEALRINKNRSTSTDLLLSLLAKPDSGEAIRKLVDHLEGYELGSHIKALTEQYDVGLFLDGVVIPALVTENVAEVCELFAIRVTEEICNKKKDTRRIVENTMYSLRFDVDDIDVPFETMLRKALPYKMEDDTFTRTMRYILPFNLVIRCSYSSGFAKLLRGPLSSFRLGNHEYKLHGVAVHQGAWGKHSPPTNGHYFAYLESGGSWERRDDSRVVDSTLEEALEKSSQRNNRPILFFYHQENETDTARTLSAPVGDDDDYGNDEKAYPPAPEFGDDMARQSADVSMVTQDHEASPAVTMPLKAEKEEEVEEEESESTVTPTQLWQQQQQEAAPMSDAPNVSLNTDRREEMPSASLGKQLFRLARATGKGEFLAKLVLSSRKHSDDPQLPLLAMYHNYKNGPKALKSSLRSWKSELKSSLPHEYAFFLCASALLVDGSSKRARRALSRRSLYPPMDSMLQCHLQVRKAFYVLMGQRQNAVNNDGSKRIQFDQEPWQVMLDAGYLRNDFGLLYMIYLVCLHYHQQIPTVMDHLDAFVAKYPDREETYRALQALAEQGYLLELVSSDPIWHPCELERQSLAQNVDLVTTQLLAAKK